MYTWSDEQLRAIEAKKSVIVSASAGSGKTTLMIERALRLIRRGVPVERMLVVTFAAAQADDMREKLARGLAQALAEATEEAERERLRRAKYRLAGADICTLHAFCANVLRSYFYLAGTEADFAVSPAPDTELRRGAACEAAIREMQKRGDPAFDALYDALSVNRGHETLKTTVFRIAELAATTPDPEEVWRRTRLAAATAAAELGAARARAERAARARGEKLLREAERAGAAELAAYLGGLLPLIGVYGAAFAAPALRMPARYRQSPALAALTEEARAWKKALGDAAKTLADRDFNVAQPLLAPLEELTRLFTARYAALKNRDGVLDFNDLERRTLTVLADPEAAAALRGKYDYLFVDEYQDINPVQQAILGALERDNAFMVGDVKQSIYAFRLCDPEIFRARYAAMSARGDAVDLNCNYRTAAPVLEFCNKLFAEMMTEEFGGADYANKAMFRPARPPALSPAVEVCLFSSPRDERERPRRAGVYSVRGDTADPERDAFYAEGLLIAERIRALVGREADGKPLGYRDMAVLLRDMKRAEGLLSALADCGIPVATRQDYRLMESAGVKALADLLRVLANPRQDWPLLSVMRSPLFGFDEDELAAIRLAARGTEADRGCFYQACEAARARFPRLDAMYARLEVWRGWAGYLTPAEVLRRVVAETRYYGGLLARADGAAEAQLARLFLDTVADSRCGDNLVSYLSYLDTAAEITVEITDGGADAVTVTTMHKSKGLEYGVVFLARLGKAFSSRDRRAEVYVDRDFGVVMKSYDPATRSKETNALRETAAEALEYRARQEELRLLYVACTRAKYKLFLIASGDFSRPLPVCTPAALAGLHAPILWILSVLQRDAGQRFPFEAKTDGVFDLDYRVEIMGGGAAERACPPPIVPRADDAFTEELRRGFGYRYPYRTDVAAKTTATELNAAAAVAVGRGEVRALAEGDGTAVGNAYHRAMQALDFAAPAAGELDRLCAQGLLSAEERALVEPARVERARAFVAALAPLALRRELPFLARFTARELYGGAGTEDTDVVVQGVIDLLVQTPEGYTLVDYKTARGDAAYLAAAYGRQLAVYAAACARAGIAVRRALIWSFASGEAVEIPLQDALFCAREEENA